ncbi:UdgX family uracil-DNA binding protein [Labrys monachus]|uniref:Type-4 uracil-DNA glycosylase n=1 Tax=Labrys monachus TaxID=217067 RepID=A0ABU0FP23_9HYPH|nr:DNA polymerase [Labrys monachus]
MSTPLAEPPSSNGNAALAALAEEAAACRRCPLYRDATQTVFGEGPATAAIMMVGEQPGDQEDHAGRPFVGPAGKVLDRALAEAGIDRGAVYVTNAVKHFKHEQRGKRRIHQKPNAGEIQQCRWWLDRELAVVEPALVVALGATAAKALMGRTMVLSREHGRPVSFADGRRGIATIHPSAVLRMRDDTSREAAFADLVDDLRQASALLR